jgi:hypothetical protein
VDSVPPDAATYNASGLTVIAKALSDVVPVSVIVILTVKFEVVVEACSVAVPTKAPVDEFRVKPAGKLPD